MIEPGPESLETKLDGLRAFAVARLTSLRELLANPAAVHEARALLAEQIGKFTLEQVAEGDKITFKANGQIDFFGEEALTRVGGAGGPIESVRAYSFTFPKVASGPPTTFLFLWRCKMRPNAQRVINDL